MPEGPELHLSSLFINRICRDLIFSGKVARNPIHKCADIEWNEPAYTISAESKGKELMLHLQSVGGSCESSFKTNMGETSKKKLNLDLSTSNRFSVKDQGKHSTTSILFTFGMSGKFEWTPVDEMLKHSHLTFFSKTDPGDDKGVRPMALSFVDYRRFGKWYQNADWSIERGPCVISDFDGFVKNVAENLNHKAFQRPICEVMLDQKFFSGIGNYLRAEILFRCRVAPFERAIQVLKASEEKENSSETAETQVMKKGGKKRIKEEAQPTDLKIADDTLPSLNIKCEPASNGDINSAKEKVTKDVKLEKNEDDFSSDSKIVWSNFSKKGQEILHLCHSVPLEVVQLGSTKYSLSHLYEDTDDGSQSFHDWVQCYYKDGMKNLADHNKRTIWFTGPAGPLVPKDSKPRGKKTSKKASKDPEVNAEPKDPPQSVTESRVQTSKKGRMTRKKLALLEHSYVKKSNSSISGRQKGKREQTKNTEVSDGQESKLKSDSKRKRKVPAAPNKSDQIKKRRKDSSDSSVQKIEDKRITRSRR